MRLSTVASASPSPPWLAFLLVIVEDFVEFRLIFGLPESLDLLFDLVLD